MTDIEIKRKELETAKRIREMGSDGFVAVCDGIACDEDNCPFVVLCSDSKGSEVTPDYVRAFIATREAELAALDKAQKPEPLYPRAKGATGPTLDDFALALIQGGYFDRGETGDVQALFLEAAELKAESDRRRGI